MNNFQYTYYMAADDSVHCYKVFAWIDANVNKADFDWAYDEDTNLYELKLLREDSAVMLVLLFGESV